MRLGCEKCDVTDNTTGVCSITLVGCAIDWDAGGGVVCHQRDATLFRGLEGTPERKSGK